MYTPSDLYFMNDNTSNKRQQTLVTASYLFSCNGEMVDVVSGLEKEKHKNKTWTNPRG